MCHQVRFLGFEYRSHSSKLILHIHSHEKYLKYWLCWLLLYRFFLACLSKYMMNYAITAINHILLLLPNDSFPLVFYHCLFLFCLHLPNCFVVHILSCYLSLFQQGFQNSKKENKFFYVLFSLLNCLVVPLVVCFADVLSCLRGTTQDIPKGNSLMR